MGDGSQRKGKGRNKRIMSQSLSSEHEQVKQSYETLGMTPLEIAEDRGLEPEVVKATLMSCSQRYRKDCGVEDGKTDGAGTLLNFSDEQLERVNQKIFEIAVSSENEGVALKAAMYIRDDKKGRLDAVKALAGTTFNVLLFNEQMKRANELIYGKQQQVIELTPSK